MKTENQRPTWQKPWKYKEGFIIAGGLFLIGLLLNHFSLVNVNLPGWPFNALLGIIFIIILIAVHFLFREKYVIQWLSGIPASISTIALFAVITLCIGLIPQSEGNDVPVMIFKLNYLKQSWLFFLSVIYLLSILGLVILRRCMSFNYKNIGFMANHLGLWLIIVTAGLSSSDFQRYQIAVEEGQTVSQGVNLNYNTKEFTFSIELVDFNIEEFPAKLALVDAETHEIDSKIKNNLTLIEEGLKLKIKDFDIEVLKYLPSAVMGSDSFFVQSNDYMSVQAAYIKCINKKTKVVVEGWINCGSPKLRSAYIKVDSSYIIAMTMPTPKKFNSKIIVTDSKGIKDTAYLEVNKTYKVDGWKLYQVGYDKDMGKYSRLSIIEAIRDPWIPVVYTGVFLMILGAIFMFWMGRK